jgi:hypothetical protein
MLHKLRMSMWHYLLGIQSAWVLLSCEADTFQFENVKLPQAKSVNEVPFCLRVRSSLRPISLNRATREVSYGGLPKFTITVNKYVQCS